MVVWEPQSITMFAPSAFIWLIMGSKILSLSTTSGRFIATVYGTDLMIRSGFKRWFDPGVSLRPYKKHIHQNNNAMTPANLRPIMQLIKKVSSLYQEKSSKGKIDHMPLIRLIRPIHLYHAHFVF